MAESATRPRFLSIPDRYLEDVKTLLGLTAEQMRALAATQNTELLNAEDSLGHVAAATGLSKRDALDAWSAATNIVRQRRRDKLDDETLLAELSALAPTEAGAMTPEQKDALLGQVLADSDDAYRLQKAEYLRNAGVPALVTARSVCELRPLLSRDKKDVEGAALVAVFTLETHDGSHDDKDMIFQVTRAGLGTLKKCVEETEKKLDVIEKAFKIKVF